MKTRVTFANAERGGIRTAYQADIMVNGTKIGYVQKVKGSESYYAYADGLQVGRGRTLTELRDDVYEYVTEERKEER